MAKEEKAPAEAEKKPKKKQAEQKDADFMYIVRIANSDLNGERPVIHALTGIKGVGPRIAYAVATRSGVPMKEKIGSLKEDQVENLKEALDDVQDTLPEWLLNRRKDYASGEDLHITGVEVQLQTMDDINMMRKMRCYKGVKHEMGHKVRGQKTRSNGRKGLTLGVSKKK